MRSASWSKNLASMWSAHSREARHRGAPRPRAGRSPARRVALPASHEATSARYASIPSTWPARRGAPALPPRAGTRRHSTSRARRAHPGRGRRGRPRRLLKHFRDVRGSQENTCLTARFGSRPGESRATRRGRAAATAARCKVRLRRLVHTAASRTPLSGTFDTCVPHDHPVSPAIHAAVAPPTHKTTHSDRKIGESEPLLNPRPPDARALQYTKKLPPAQPANRHRFLR